MNSIRPPKEVTVNARFISHQQTQWSSSFLLSYAWDLLLPLSLASWDPLHSLQDWDRLINGVSPLEAEGGA